MKGSKYKIAKKGEHSFSKDSFITNAYKTKITSITQHFLEGKGSNVWGFNDRRMTARFFEARN